MTLFNFKTGSLELLDCCNDIWELFIQNQVCCAGEMSDGVESYLRALKDGGLLQKTQSGKLQVQLVYPEKYQSIIGFCITSLDDKQIGEIEVLYVLDKYRGNKLGSQLLQNALTWLNAQNAIGQKLVVAAGNENVIIFYRKHGFFPGYTTLFRA